MEADPQNGGFHMEHLSGVWWGQEGGLVNLGLGVFLLLVVSAAPGVSRPALWWGARTFPSWAAGSPHTG